TWKARSSACVVRRRGQERRARRTVKRDPQPAGEFQSNTPPIMLKAFAVHRQSPVVLPSVNTPAAVAVGALIQFPPRSVKVQAPSDEEVNMASPAEAAVGTKTAQVPSEFRENEGVPPSTVPVAPAASEIDCQPLQEFDGV